MHRELTIARRFIGPPESANGGYSCGLAAQALTGSAIAVTLRVPPPVERPLRLQATADHAALYDGDALVARAEPTVLDSDLPEPITLAHAADAADRFDVESYYAAHYFPGCFTCGPAREGGDGLRLFPGEIDADRDLIAWPWVPDRSLPTTAGAVDPAIVWAALDCPSGWAWYHRTEPQHPHVLGTLAAEIRRAPQSGEPTVTAGWARSTPGRKQRSGSAIWSGDGELLAHARATWIGLTEEQFGQFRAEVS